MNRLFELYKIVLLAHIQSKTVHSQFHEKSEGFYEVLFDVFHLLSEKRQDTGQDAPGKEDDLIDKAYSAIEEAKAILEAMAKEKNTVGTDNLIRTLLDRLEWSCGDARAFIEDEKEDYSDILEKLPKSIPKSIKLSR